MRRILAVITLFFCLGAAVAAAAPDVAVDFDSTRARIYKGAPGRALSGSSSAAPASVVARFLRESGLSASTTDSLYEVARYRSPVTGLTHIRMEQAVAGVRVADAYVKAALNERGELVHLIQNIASVRG